MEAVRKLAEASKTNPLLAQPTRLSIMLILLMRESIPFTELQRILGLTSGNLGSHVEKLERVGYVKRRKGFNFFRYITYISITEKGVVETLNFISNLKEAIESLPLSKGDAATVSDVQG